MEKSEQQSDDSAGLLLLSPGCQLPPAPVQPWGWQGTTQRARLGGQCGKGSLGGATLSPPSEPSVRGLPRSLLVSRRPPWGSWSTLLSWSTLVTPAGPRPLLAGRHLCTGAGWVTGTPGAGPYRTSHLSLQPFIAQPWPAAWRHGALPGLCARWLIVIPWHWTPTGVGCQG